MGNANAATGAVAVNLNAVDPDGNPLTYAVTMQPADGSLTTTAPGVYVFTPTQAAGFEPARPQVPTATALPSRSTTARAVPLR